MSQPTQCRVCRHPERPQIDKLLLTPGGPTLSEIAGTFGFSVASVSRHRSDHLSESLRKALERGTSGSPVQALTEIRGVVERFRKGWDAVEKIMMEAVANQDGELALKAAGKFGLMGREFRKTIELLGKATGELRVDEGGGGGIVIVVPALVQVGAPADLTARIPPESLPSPGSGNPGSDIQEAEWEEVQAENPPGSPNGVTPSASS